MTTVTLEQALSRGYGVWRSFTCPVHDDANPSARVNVQTGKWVCMVCRAKGTTAGYVADPIKQLDQMFEMLSDDLPEKSESWLDQFDAGPVHEYWLGRFSEDACRAFRLGWDGVKGKPCYPLRGRSGRPLGVVHRNLDGDGPKYKYPYGVKTSELLFGLHEATQTDRLFLVEGAMDVVAVREAGHDALGTYGARLYEEQLTEIIALHPREVLIAYDMDKAGRVGTAEAMGMFADAGILARRVTWDDRYKDLGEMDLATRSNTLAKVLASTST